MREVVLTAAVCGDREALHRYLAEELAFPSWYRHNLDALYDCLSEVRERVTINVPDAEALEGQLGPYVRRLIEVLAAASRENPLVVLRLE